jgi:hypothetical protein
MHHFSFQDESAAGFVVLFEFVFDNAQWQHKWNKTLP